jgi:single-strand DNA-binding protein
VFNKVILVGRLTRDVELKYLPSGSSVGTFSIAVGRVWKDKNTGEQKEEVMFIDVDSFGRSAEIANQYLNKGSKVLIEGRLVQDRWTDANGQNRNRHKILAENIKFMETKAEAAQSRQQSEVMNPQNTYTQNETQQVQQQTKVQNNSQNIKTQAIPEVDINDDEVPY